jgi:ketosteroid isomerase-like protein
MAHELTWTEFLSWLDEFKINWESGNARLGAQMFTPAATYRDSRFYPPRQGHDEIEDFWKYELVVRKEDVKFSHQVVACFGDVGICRWEATLTDYADLEDPKRKGHSGIFFCRFATAKQVEFLEEWREISFI